MLQIYLSFDGTAVLLHASRHVRLLPFREIIIAHLKFRYFESGVPPRVRYSLQAYDELRVVRNGNLSRRKIEGKNPARDDDRERE